MGVSVEIDWVAAWYNTWSVIDTTINFWITVTFAVIVAVHALGERATKSVTRPLAALYAGFALYTASRMVNITFESATIAAELRNANVDFYTSPVASFVSGLSGILFGIIFLLGTTYTTYFVLKASKRAASDDATLDSQ